MARLTSAGISKLARASSTARPLHASISATISGVMKSCDVRDANTIWAAAARMRVSALEVGEDDGAIVSDVEGKTKDFDDLGEIVGSTGRLVGGIVKLLACMG